MLNNYLMVLKKNIDIFIIILSLIFSGCTEKDSIYLVRNGKTNYSIYLDPSAPEHVKFAAEELEIYFRKVAGISPSIIVAENPPPSPFISLGYNSAVRDAGFWKIIFHKIKAGSISFAMGENIPPWLIPDPGQPLIIVSAKK